MTELVLAVDGGNVKTDLALITSDGHLQALVRGGRSSPHYVGVEGCVALLQGLLAEARRGAAQDGGPLQVASAQIMVAGADLPEELEALRHAIDQLGWSERLVVENDTFALLRSGSDRGWGIAVVCGGGINCVGLARDGRQVRFPSLGPITGDWGGGYDVGMAGLMAAARSADGRGPRSILETTVPAYYGCTDPLDVARLFHLRTLPMERLNELARVVFAAADEDAAAAEIMRRLADEVIAFARATLRRLELASEAPDVVLGGGLIRAAPASLIARIEAGIRAAAPGANVIVAAAAPIVGAALLGLDALQASPEVTARARAELHEAFVRVEGDGSRVSNGEMVGVGANGELLSGGAHG